MQVGVLAHQFDDASGSDLALGVGIARFLCHVRADLGPEGLGMAAEDQLGTRLEHLFEARQPQLVIAAVASPDRRPDMEDERQFHLFRLAKDVHVERIVKRQVGYILADPFEPRVFVRLHHGAKIGRGGVAQHARIQVEERDESVWPLSAELEDLFRIDVRVAPLRAAERQEHALVDPAFVEHLEEFFRRGKASAVELCDQTHLAGVNVKVDQHFAALHTWLGRVQVPSTGKRPSGCLRPTSTSMAALSTKPPR